MTETTITDATAGKLVGAAQIENECPERLEALGNRIRAHLERAERAERHADNHRTSAALLLAEAKKACDESGFDAFRERFCPNLGRSRTYELLQIACGTKSAEEIRAENAERSRRHRAAKKAAEPAVRCVTDYAEPESAALDGDAPAPAWTPPEPTPPTTRGRRTSAEIRLEQFRGAVQFLNNTVDNFCAVNLPPSLDPDTAAVDSAMIAQAIRRLRKYKAALDTVAQAGDAKRVAA